MNWRTLPYITATPEDMAKFGIDTTYLRKSVDGSLALIHVDKIEDTGAGVALATLASKEDYAGGAYSHEEALTLMASIDWNVEEAQLDDYFEFNRQQKIKNIKKACNMAILEGFDSDATGEVKHYACDELHQANFSGEFSAALAVVAGIFPAETVVKWKDTSMPKCVPFDPAHILTLGAHMKAFIEGHREREDDLTELCTQATTQAELDAVDHF